MSHIEFRTLTHQDATAKVTAMMEALYAEDASAYPVDRSRFPVTIQTLLAEPARGCIILFLEDSGIHGYAILIPYWSNEFGGTILYVDELFVIPSARSRGIGHKFFEFISRQRPYDAVAIALEVSPANSRAQKLYESIGFRVRRNACLICRISG